MSEPVNENEPELCPVCGNTMVIQDGEAYCLKCAAEIDWLGDDDEDEAEEPV